MQLRDWFRAHPRCALGFSGGTDSAYLLWAGLDAGADIRPIFVRTPFQTGEECRRAEEFCQKLGRELTILETDPLSEPAIGANPPDRCYHCKRGIFSLLCQWAGERSIPTVLEGSNDSDDLSDRPGMRAIRELGVESPLRLCGLTKEVIRENSRQAGLPTWDLPSSACLATRFPTGRQITREDLARVERGEALLRQRGFSDLRIRLREWGGLLQLPAEQHPAAKRDWQELERMLREDFPTLRLDPKGR